MEGWWGERGMNGGMVDGERVEWRDGGARKDVCMTDQDSATNTKCPLHAHGQPLDYHHQDVLTSQQMLGFFFASMCWVSGEGSSSYLSKGKLSISIGATSVSLNHTTGLEDLAG